MQIARRNLSKYARSVLALQLEPLYAAEAKRMHDANGGDKKSDAYKESASQKSDAPKVRTDEQLAKLAGTSRDTIRKVKVIEQEAEKGNQTELTKGTGKCSAQEFACGGMPSPPSLWIP